MPGTPSGTFYQEHQLLQSIRDIAPRRRLREINSATNVSSQFSADHVKYVLIECVILIQLYIFFIYHQIQLSMKCKFMTSDLLISWDGGKILIIIIYNTIQCLSRALMFGPLG